MSVEKAVLYSVNGQSIHAREEGPLNGQVALLIHGWSSSWYALSPLVPVLSHRYHCIAVDLPGYGDSPCLPQKVTITAYADLLAELLRGITDRPAVLVGHSMGGMISLTMTLRHPELVERMVLIDPTVSGHLSLFIDLFISPITLLERMRLFNFIIARAEPLFLNITDRLMRPSQFAEQTGLTEEDYYRLRADARRPGQGRVRAECYWAMRDGDLRGKLDGIDTPALVIWGLEDNTVPLRDASILAQEIPDADMRFIPNAGHWPQFEKPELTRRYVSAFLSTPLKLLNLEF
ncbi:MAG: alpha/beta hydrolase [Anaerolineae bacterium]|nr:alpha/beta hydrolase [Anaerolineae bacterium]